MDKELMDCLLLNEDLPKEAEVYLKGIKFGCELQLQSPKLKVYIEEQKKKAVKADKERAKEIIRSLLPIADGKCIYCNRGDKRDENNMHIILNGEDVMCLEHEFYEEAREYLEE